MKISIFWTGYVWLVTWVGLAEMGHEVTCVDVDKEKIENLKKGIIPIHENWLTKLLQRNVKEQRINFTLDAKQSIESAEVVFCAVGTPPWSDGRADMTYVYQVARSFAQYLNWYKVLVNKSTVPVGTAHACKKIIKDGLSERWVDYEFGVVSNPEFLREWRAVRDFLAPNRIVVWVDSLQDQKIMEKVYKPLIRIDRPLVVTDLKSAEIIKYASNAFLATKISFMNEIANFIDRVWGDVTAVSQGMGMDERISSKFLHAGMGYWWSCFPKDVQALVQTGKDYAYDFKIIKATEEVNQKQKYLVVEKLKKHYTDLSGKKIAIWGLSFKPKTDDIREAPSLIVIDELLKLGVESIQCFDPVAMNNMKKQYDQEPRVQFVQENYSALQDVDALLLLTERDEFRMPNFEKIKLLMRGNVLIDGRNIWSREDVEEYGITYEGIGK